MPLYWEGNAAPNLAQSMQDTGGVMDMIPDLDTWKLTAKRGLWAYKGLKSVFALFAVFRRLGKSGKKRHAITPEKYKRVERNKQRNHKISGRTVCIWFCKCVWTVKKRYF